MSCRQRQVSPAPQLRSAAGGYLLQVHVLGQLLLQHVLELLVHLPQVLVSGLDQVSED